MDEFGIKIVSGSTRSPAVPPDDWKRMSQEERNDMSEILKKGHGQTHAP